MEMLKLQTTRLLVICALLPLAMLAGCGTPIPKNPDAGVVVEAPKRDLGEVPEPVRATPPKEAGYFQNELLNYSNGSPKKPTTSTAPTPPAARTPTK
jgi:hypothetical protein